MFNDCDGCEVYVVVYAVCLRVCENVKNVLNCVCCACAQLCAIGYVNNVC